MKRFQFCRLHVPTGERSTGEMDALNLCELWKTLNGYTRQQPGVWAYWTEPHHEAGRWV